MLPKDATPDVSTLILQWIPSDPDGPLPMSSVYRDKLDILCSSIEIGRGFPPDIPPEKRQVLHSTAWRQAHCQCQGKLPVSKTYLSVRDQCTFVPAPACACLPHCQCEGKLPVSKTYLLVRDQCTFGPAPASPATDVRWPARLQAVNTMCTKLRAQVRRSTHTARE